MPIWIGGRTRRSLRRAVTLADGWCPFNVPMATAAEWLRAWELPDNFEVVLMAEHRMATYILLSTLSTQGVQTLKSNLDRLREVNKDVEELGAQVLHQWATLGEWDFVSVVEAPDLATVARVSVALGARGSTKIETLPALTIDELLAALE